MELLNTLKPINSFHTLKKCRDKNPVLESTADFFENSNSRTMENEFVNVDYANEKKPEKTSVYIPNQYDKAKTDKAESMNPDIIYDNITKAKRYIEKGNYDTALAQLNNIEHPIADFLRAKILKEEGHGSYMIHLEKSAEKKYPPAMLAYGMFTEQYSYVVESAKIYTKAFRVVAKLFQQGKIDKKTFISLNNKNRFGNIDELDKAFIKQTSAKIPPI